MKNVMKMLFAAIAAVILFGACVTVPEIENKPTPGETESAEESDSVILPLADAAPASPEGASELQLSFNLELLKKLGELEEGNLFYSPLSINAALTMAYFGTAGETRREMADTLGYVGMDITEVAAYQKYLLQSYRDSGDTTFITANSIWIADIFNPKKSYIDTMEEVFETKVTKLDFNQSSAVDTLNDWINGATNGMIEELFDKNDNPFTDGPPTAMVLLNAIYFNGKWTMPFDPNKTYYTDFYGADNTSSIKMMSSGEKVMGNMGDGYISVRLPYGEDERFTMVAVLPEDIDGFIGKMTAESLNVILTEFEQKEEALVRIPVFEMEKKIKLNDVLIALGINKAFSQSEADFSGMHEDDMLFIDEVLHKAKIKVDEEGTEAAAATSVEIALRSMPMDRFEFIADKPFLFFIVDTENDLVLFTGKVMDLG